MRKNFLGLLGLSFLLLVSLAACGKTPEPPTSTPLPAVAPTMAVTTVQAANKGGVVTTAAVAQQQNGTDLTAVRAPRDVVKSFVDAQGRTVKLLYGRGTGHGGDYGWAHIMGKHLNGIWYDGGTITTFPQAVGAKTPEAVIDLIGKSLQDKNPDDQGNGRFGYNYAVPGTNKDIFTVVGNDGTIITSYPVPHGSKNMGE